MSGERNQARAWIGVTLLAGAAYFAVGKGFALPTTNGQVWRVAAWLVSGVIYAAHIGYEHFKLGSPPRRAAAHVAIAVAVGALALAFAGMINSVTATSTLRPIWLLALVLWPAFTAIPAYLVALVLALILARMPRQPASR